MKLHAFMDDHFAHAAMRLRLDEQLGNWHGLSWEDYVLLAVLDADDGSEVEAAALAARLGLTPSALLRRLLPLEKIGLLARHATVDGARCVVLRAGGRRLAREARATAEEVCALED
jgi:DNA-binding MarR family transcriptional regulator